jgi:hypothetical protein
MVGGIVFFSGGLSDARAGTWSITIPIEPFSATDEYSRTWRSGTSGPYVVSTEVSLDFIRLPAENLSGLANRSFQFPVNPIDGYIDGSLLLCGSHNPVNVTEIEFGSAGIDRITARLVATIDFEFELSDLLNVETTLVADLVLVQR